MKRTLLHIILIITIALPMVLVPFIATAAGGDEEKLAVSGKFLHAYLLKTEDVSAFVPARREHLFGPYPFKGPLRISTPKVDGNQALLEITGTIADSKFPEKCAILFYNHDYKWHVRQVLFYDKIPRLFGLPSKSVNAKDRSFEPEVKVMGENFLVAWEKGQVDRMLANWFNWPKSEREPVKGLHMSNLKMTTDSTTWGDTYVGYSVKLTYRWGIFSYSMTVHGGLLLVEENGVWKVRGNQMVFDF